MAKDKLDQINEAVKAGQNEKATQLVREVAEKNEDSAGKILDAYGVPRR